MCGKSFWYKEKHLNLEISDHWYLMLQPELKDTRLSREFIREIIIWKSNIQLCIGKLRNYIDVTVLDMVKQLPLFYNNMHTCLNEQLDNAVTYTPNLT